MVKMVLKHKLLVVISLAVVVLTMALPTMVSAQGTTTCQISILMEDSLILRNSPSFGSGVTTTLVRGEFVCLIGRNSNTTWLQVARGGVAAGWAPANAFWATVPFTVLPVTDGTVTPPPVQQTYVVQRGDTVYSISRRFGVTIPALVAANNIGANFLIFAGQTLIIPGAVTPPPPTQRTYVVQRGDFLVRIANQFGLHWRTLAAANNIQSPYIIYPGQVLVIPTG